jgi:hypothetical protein
MRAEVPLAAGESTAALLSLLPQRVLRHLSAESRERLADQPHEVIVHFESLPGTLLCADLPWRSASGREAMRAQLEALAGRSGGSLDPCVDRIAVLHFPEPLAALETALRLLQPTDRPRMPLALASGPCIGACLRNGARPLRVFVGTQVERGLDLLRLAAPGTLRIAADAFAQMQGRLERVPGWELRAEYEHERMTAVCLAPRAQATVGA